jgi:hypothetical protein
MLCCSHKGYLVILRSPQKYVPSSTYDMSNKKWKVGEKIVAPSQNIQTLLKFEILQII